jgi:hypothetical protein
LLRFTVHVVVPPGRTVESAHVSVRSTPAAMTVTCVLLLTEPVRPVTVDMPVFTGEDVAVNCAARAPADTRTDAGTCTVVAELLSRTSTATVGALVIVAVQLAVAPVAILVGEHVRLASVDAIAVIPVLTALPFSVAPIVTTASAATEPSCAVNVPVLVPCLTTIPLGTVTCTWFAWTAIVVSAAAAEASVTTHDVDVEVNR